MRIAAQSGAACGWGNRPGHQVFLRYKAMRTARTKLSAIEPEADAEVIESSSDRSLGFVFAAASAFIGAWPLIHARPPRIWLVLLGGFALAAIYVPWTLQPLNMIWTRLGAVLNRIVTPIAMGVVFFL
jgi:hypothetical protein